MAVAFGYGVAQLVAIPCYDGEVPTAPTNPVCTVSVDGAGFGAADNAPSVVGPVLFLTLSATEMEAAVVVVKVASDNLEDHYGGPYYPGGDWTAARAGSIDTIAADVAGLDGEAMRGTDGAYTGTPPTAASIATAVWAYLTSAATTDGSIGKFLVDLGARIGAFSGSGVNTILGAFKALLSKAASAPSDIGGTFDPATDSTEAIRDRLTTIEGAGFDASTDSLEAIRDASSVAGTGVRTVPFTLSDGAGLLANGVKVHVEDGSGNTVAGPLVTNASGVVTFYLDDGDYSIVSASTSVWQGNAEDVTVDADSEDGVAITLTAQVLPTPSSADKYTIIINAADEFGSLVGASAWSIKVTQVWPRGLAADNLVQLTEQNPITVDGNGQASFEIAQTTTAFTLAITPTLADGTAGKPEYITVDVDAAQANASDQIYLSDLMDD